MSTEFKKNLLPFEGEAYFIRDCFSPSETKRWMEALCAAVPWQQKPIKLFGRKMLQPRLVAWYGDQGCNYRYSGLTLKPLIWNRELMEIKKDVEAFTHEKFNSALLNLYRNEKDSMGAHHDNEKELGPSPIIASVSLGANRRFLFSHVSQKKVKVTLDLCDGSLLLMKGSTQKYWKHAVPKQKTASESRLNITFRYIFLEKD